MQEPGRRPAPSFVGVDLRRPKGYPSAPAPAAKEAAEERPAHEAAPAGDPCPRCQSRDTKFCYYNNYNTSQPRHFCRSCRRYWTKGGSLRNVPVGGGTRKASSSAVAKNSKRRRVAPAADPAAANTTADVANDIAPATPAPSTEPPATVAAEEPATATVAAEEPAAPTAPDGGCADTSASVALELAPTDVGDNSRKEELPEPAQFEWPSGCDLGSYWGAAGVFSDTDSQMFLNLP